MATISCEKIYKGDIFYRFLEDDELYIIRVIRCKSTEKFVVRDNDKKEFSITRKELYENYSRLKNNAYISFYIAKLANNGKDVCVTINRREDLDKGINESYAICRQQVTNLFETVIIKDDLFHLGMSVSKDTCPPKVNYQDAFACDGLESGESISIYLDDTLDTILKFIDTEKYDRVLNNIYESIDHRRCTGACKTLRELLEYHDFMYDFYLGNQIVRVPFEVIDKQIDLEQTLYLEHLTKHVIIEPIVADYGYDIDLSKIERDHIRIIDINNNIYIITYLEGEYVNRYYRDNVQDKREAICMLKYVNKTNNNK